MDVTVGRGAGGAVSVAARFLLARGVFSRTVFIASARTAPTSTRGPRAGEPPPRPGAQPGTDRLRGAKLLPRGAAGTLRDRSRGHPERSWTPPPPVVSFH